MTVSLSEALAGCLDWHPNVSDDLLELVVGLAVDDGCSEASEQLLQYDSLPLELAERLAARRGVSAAEVALFASRDDVPAETLLDWVRKERRVTVLAEIAAKPDLPQEVFEALAARDGVALKNALLFNDTAPLRIRADIAAEPFCWNGSSRTHWDVQDTVAGSELLQRAVFDRLSLDLLREHAGSVSVWEGLTAPQLHVLLDAVERHAAEIPTSDSYDTYSHRHRVGAACNTAKNATGRLAGHPSADEALLNRLETFAGNNPDYVSSALADAVAVARLRLALLGGGSARLDSVSHSKLVELADAGVLCDGPVTKRALTNPLFDADVAVKVLEALPRHGRRAFGTERLLHAWSQDLIVGLRLLRIMQRVPCPSRLSEHVAAASTAELIEALGSVADDPEWGLRLAEEIAEHAGAVDGVVPDEVVGRFGWFPDHVSVDPGSRLGALTVEFLYRRFGAHAPTWRVFGSIADPSTPIVEAAALAVSTEPPPGLPRQEPSEPEPPVLDAPCVQVPLF